MAKRVEADWVKEHLNDGKTYFINVLSRDDHQKEHIPGTMNVPVGAPDFEEQVAEIVPDRNTPVVVYCASLTCEASPKAAKKLEELGYTNVFDFKAGMAGWKEAGNRAESSAPTTTPTNARVRDEGEEVPGT